MPHVSRYLSAGKVIKKVWSEGWDKFLEKGFLDREHHQSPNALSLLAITVAPEYQGKGVSTFFLNLIKA
ncbi:MAG: hypothetical protein PUP91_22075 [Rhizonema sp. PD37]|nr:hypothetical protein [Rhizonema sp. PD37]